MAKVNPERLLEGSWAPPRADSQFHARLSPVHGPETTRRYGVPHLSEVRI